MFSWSTTMTDQLVELLFYAKQANLYLESQKCSVKIK